MPSSVRPGPPLGVGRPRNLVNSMVLRYHPHSGGASLEVWEGHDTLQTIWLSDTLLAQAGPPWRGGRESCK
eukprot:1805321-Pyramimonas_sp.AAC.1